MDMTESDMDFEFYTDTSDSDDRDDTESIYDSHAQSLLSNLDQSIDKIDGYLAFERGFSYGDAVRLATDPFGQIGQVVNIEMLVDLESSCGEIIEKLSSKQLIRIRPFTEDDYVIYGPWIGKVVKVYDLVTVLLDDGTKYTISTRDKQNLVSISPGFLEDVPYLYIPGQRVKVNRSSCFDSWWCCIWDGGHCEGTICSVESGPVLVSWISCVVHGLGIAPSDLVDGKDLTLLSWFHHVNWQLGDWCKLPFCDKSASQYAEMTAVDHGLPSINRKGASQMIRTERKTNKPDLLYCITRTKTNLDVLWQDGTLSFGLSSQTLAPVGTIGDHDFWPGQFVLEKEQSEYPPASSAKHLGIVKSMDAKESIVTVKWSFQELNHSNDYPRNFSQESHSAYELMEHPDYSYCLGDIVYRLPMEESSFHADLESGCFVAGDYLSCIGNVVGRKEGYFEVKWASGTTSEVEPTEIFGIDKFNISSTIPVFHGEAAEGTPCKKASVQDIDLSQRNEKDLAEMELNSNENLNLSCSSTFIYPCKAISFLTNMASSLFVWSGSGSKCGDANGSSSYGENWSGQLEPSSLETTYIFDRCNDFFRDEVPKNEVGRFSAVENYQNLKQATTMSDMEPKVEILQFKQFDIVINCSDHHFVSGIGDNHLAKRVWQRKVLEEWRILQKDLPDGISIRVYEDRMDLLRACINGAAGTPYHDALFFFDICFPPDYPHEPPAVHYISNGLRLNPNLYESGKVCLSLLRTWTGSGTEVWDPDHSTLLQVLLSLQALVLNAKPYFNEAGYDKQIGKVEGERNSTSYNENAFLLSRKSMLYQMRRPPKHFEELVQQHFSSRSHAILTTCKNYIDGTENSCDPGLGENTGDDERGISTGFKMMLAKLFPMLVVAFSEGVNCNQLDDQVAFPLEPSKEASEEPLPYPSA